MGREENKFEDKVLGKISSEISIQQGCLSTSVIELEIIVQNALILFQKLCDMSLLSSEVQ